ncbi:MAG: exopolysaccharide biosynthesis polyprenyl glycosylphosphotransferase [Candidatus Azotimanducaceae bacterium]|jgi:exopolysaccharide biosynthesis polyprenyl glycosylphosphotransferase
MNSGTIRGVRSFIILALDLVLILSIFSGIYYLRLDKLPDFTSPDLWLIATTFIFVLFLAGTYFREANIHKPKLPIRTFLNCLAAGILCVVWLYLLGPQKFSEYFGRGILPTATLACGIATTSVRFFINQLYHRQERGLELLYVGYSKSADAFLRELENHQEVRSVTVVSNDDINSEFPEINIWKRDLKPLLKEKKWQCVIVDPSRESSVKEKEELISLRLRGTPILSLADFYEKFWYMIPVHDIGNDWFLRSQGFSMLDNPISGRVKRLIDIAMSIILLAVSVPVLALCGFFIKLTSRGPIFFRQTRVGIQGKHFTIFKLRTMRLDAEPNGAQWAKDNDPRITHFGNFLRQTRLDELPQCWNVLRGNMSLVGPRPERPEFTKELSEKIPYYDLRHLVKPGISGWAQVIFPYGASVDDSLRKLQYELYYIKNQSLLLDLNIMLRTLITIFQRSGR